MRAQHTFLAVIAAAAVALGACGSDSGDPGAGNPKSQATDYAKALADAPPTLARLYDQGDAILDGGKEALDRQLADLQGYPVVVNVWGSWCNPCRTEFPLFQAVAAERGTKVAFLGVDSEDSVDAANTFLDELPLPYPSYSDPDGEVKDDLRAFGLPATAFYDTEGKLAYLKQGPYESEDDLTADIEHYASG
jgi:cytochrome c biogenesis protein CcmG/thiol:disulfide interchange protein DsbE